MKERERGLAMLTCPLGDEGCRPLSASQYQALSARVMAKGKDGGKSVDLPYLQSLGYTQEEACHILLLLDREELLTGYLAYGKSLGLEVLTRIHPEFPRELRGRRGKNCPTISWYLGNLEILTMEKVAVVGTRDPSPEQADFARQVGRTIGETGMALVSGGAKGVDTLAAESCLAAGGYVITMVPDQLEKRLSLANAHTLLWSDYGYDLAFSNRRAFDRNDNIHSLAQRAVVIGPKVGSGGTWQGASENLKHQWCPLAVFDDQSPGAIALAERGAMVARDWADALFRKPSQMAFFP